MERMDKVRVGVLGAGAWARFAHLPGYARDPRCELVAIADPVIERAQEFAAEFNIPNVYDSHEELIARDDIHLVDVCTPSATHFDLAWSALSAGKHVLCEKPVAYDFTETRRAAELARSKGLKTKLGFTFRYSPAMRYMKELIDDGFVGTPDIFLGEFASGAIGSIQTSFVTVGNYPGLEARVYGSKGALICRLVEENGVAESLKAATGDSVEFKELEIPERFYPTGGSKTESWRSLFYANLVASFISEIR